MGRSSKTTVFLLALCAASSPVAAQPFGGGYGPFGGDADPDLAPPAPPFLPPPIALAPPRCPLIIAVGRGLRHPAKTRIVSGRPSCV